MSSQSYRGRGRRIKTLRELEEELRLLRSNRVGFGTRLPPHSSRANQLERDRVLARIPILEQEIEQNRIETRERNRIEIERRQAASTAAPAPAPAQRPAPPAPAPAPPAPAPAPAPAGGKRVKKTIKQKKTKNKKQTKINKKQKTKFTLYGITGSAIINTGTIGTACPP